MQDENGADFLLLISQLQMLIVSDFMVRCQVLCCVNSKKFWIQVWIPSLVGVVGGTNWIGNKEEIIKMRKIIPFQKENLAYNTFPWWRICLLF